MKIYMSKSFADEWDNISDERLKLVNDSIEELKSMSKTEIINHSNTIELENKNISLYAFGLQASLYIIFSFKDKNSLVVLDLIEFIDNKEIKSLIHIL